MDDTQPLPSAESPAAESPIVGSAKAIGSAAARTAAARAADTKTAPRKPIKQKGNMYQAEYLGSGTFKISKPKRRSAKRRQSALKNRKRGSRK
jgi:hypothetical protein